MWRSLCANYYKKRFRVESIWTGVRTQAGIGFWFLDAVKIFLRRLKNKTEKKGCVRQVSEVMLTVCHLYWLLGIVSPPLNHRDTSVSPVGGRVKAKKPHPQTFWFSPLVPPPEPRVFVLFPKNMELLRKITWHSGGGGNTQGVLTLPGAEFSKFLPRKL